jgi:hypothetical protein
MFDVLDGGRCELREILRISYLLWHLHPCPAALPSQGPLNGGLEGPRLCGSVRLNGGLEGPRLA